MDEALKAAWRAAQAAPHDPQARAAYGQALLRSGRRLAALLELAAAEGRATPEGTRTIHARLPQVERPLRPGSPAARWSLATLGRAGPPTAPLLDAELGLVGLWHDDDVWAIAALVPWPACGDCAARPAPRATSDIGQAECPRCDGRGEVIEFTGRAEERLPCDACGGSGRVPCSTCDGTGLAPRRGRPARCEHDQLGPALHRPASDGPAGLRFGRLGGWTVHACEGCPLCVLRAPNGDEHPACAGCGTFACDGTCDESATRVAGSDP